VKLAVKKIKTTNHRKLKGKKEKLMLASWLRAYDLSGYQKEEA
jgi:hypothetical protein